MPERDVLLPAVVVDVRGVAKGPAALLEADVHGVPALERVARYLVER